jgi:hypothetical protein
MRRSAIVVVAVAVVFATVAAAGSAGIPGAKSIKICAAAGPYWPTMTLALRGNSAWIACKQQSRVIHINARTGKRLKSVRLRAPAIAVAAGYGSIWALDSGGTLYRLHASGRIAARIFLAREAAPYNIWIGGGSVWVADDQGAHVVRVSPKTNKVVARAAVGDGPASMAFAGSTAWVMNHRDRVLTEIDLATNRSKRLTVIPGDAPERLAWAGGRLWITGRGTDLLEVNPGSGSVVKTVEIGASGIDVVADGGDLWIPTRSAEVDQSGFPTMETLKRVSVSSATVVSTTVAVGRVDVHGLRAGNGTVWLADNTNGSLYSVSR